MSLYEQTEAARQAWLRATERADEWVRRDDERNLIAYLRGQASLPVPSARVPKASRAERWLAAQIREDALHALPQPPPQRTLVRARRAARLQLEIALEREAEADRENNREGP